MIQRSGSSALSLLPRSAATSRTCATSFLSSVSGMVKNWGACGSIAPPITVDIMAFLLQISASYLGSLSVHAKPPSLSLPHKAGPSHMDFLESLPGLGTVWHVVAAAAPQN